MIIKTGLIPRAAFSIFGISVYWYAIFIAIAFLIGFIWTRFNSKKYGVSFEDIIDLSLVMIPASIICARAYYVIFNFDLYRNSFTEIFNIRNGGLAIYGGLIGAVIVIVIFCKIKKIKIFNVTDCIASIVPLCQAIGRLGNYVNIEAYGQETNGFLKMEIIENGMRKYVHPTFLYEGFFNIILFVILLKISKNRKFKGQVTLTYCIGYGLIRFFIEGLRADSLMFGDFRVSQVLSLVIFVVALTLYIVLWRKNINSR